MNRTGYVLWSKMLLAALLCLPLVGCGGGGGGGGSTGDIVGQVLLVETDQPPSPAATVAVGGQNITTDTQGNFILRGVSTGGTATLTVTAPGVQTLTQTLPILKANATNSLGTIYVLQTSSTSASYKATASGTVVRADTGAIVTGATVTLNGQKQVTPSSGKFSFSGLPVGLGATGKSIGVITASGFDDKQIVLDLGLGASPPDNDLGSIPLSPPVGTIPNGPSTLRGQVTVQGVSDPSGTTVTLIKQTTGATVGVYTVGSDGKYAFWVVAGSYTLRASRTSFQTATQNVTLVSPDQPITTNLTLTP